MSLQEVSKISVGAYNISKRTLMPAATTRFNSRIGKSLVTATIFALIFSVQVLSQPPSAFPVDISVTCAPRPVMADGRIRLLYELHLTNFSPKPIELTGLDVFGSDSAKLLASYRGKELEVLLTTIGPPTDSTDKVQAIAGGRTVVIFIDIVLDPGMRAPAELHHKLLLSIAAKDGHIIVQTLKGPVVVVGKPAPVLRSPLQGSGWVAFNGLSSGDHRRTLLPVDGKVRISQRFAIDWMLLGPDGRLFHGESNSNANFYSYGAKVFAVGDGRISSLKDGLPDNAGNNEQSGRTITLDNVTGNYLILDLGNGYFAFYAHLQPGSLQVKTGDKVKAGQVLGLLGNSGNSDAPHLHFHLMDANSPLGSEGLPYELDTFTQLGIVDDPAALDTGQSWQSKTKAMPVVHRLEFPVDNAVMILSPQHSK